MIGLVKVSSFGNIRVAFHFTRHVGKEHSLVYVICVTLSCRIYVHNAGTVAKLMYHVSPEFIISL